MSAWLNIQLAELAAQVSGQDFSDAERDALVCVEEIANRADMQLTFKQEPGDVLFINNLAVMHRREKYIDVQEQDGKRMLYRMWINLHDTQARSLNPCGIAKGHSWARAGDR
jgi:alpha-ketoglutarate-dependent taurine dioxygenase